VKKGLFLYGINCTLEIWDEIKDALKDVDATFVAYPHEVTQNAHQISDISKWVYDTYGDEQFDFIVGHSMGGIIALQLAAGYKVGCDELIFIESNLRPANEFYRNLMLPDNMMKYGNKIKDMFQKESPYYRDDLKSSLQQGFDFTPYIHEIPCRIFGIYGDRGVEHYGRRMEDLCLDKDTEEKIHFKFIRNACHMPMIENAQELADILMQCVK
jgi:pimeloyl-ACP methyl ester carboxylesterase